MKKMVQRISLMMCLLLMLSTPLVEASSTIKPKVIYNGVEILFPDAQPYVDKAGRVQVPIRYIGDALQLNVSYATKEKARYAIFSDGSTTVEFILNTATYFVNGVEKSMDTKSEVVSGRTYTAARYLSEQFGASVNWNSSSRTVEITRSGKGTTPSPPPVEQGVIDQTNLNQLTGKFTYSTDEQSISQYRAMAISLLKNNALYMSNRNQAIQYFDSVATQLIASKNDRTNTIDAYKQKSTASQYKWDDKAVADFTAALNNLSGTSTLDTQVFEQNKTLILSYRYTVEVNSNPVWLEVQFTFKQLQNSNYELIAIKA